MAINKNVFLHDADRAALKTLEAIPGFSQLMKSYMKAWNEKIFYIQNMSSNIHINQQQLKKYHDMLPGICNKLGIEIPDLFLQLNPYPNSYTSGDSKPFIVMTSGLIETLPERLIPTVLAHECGHIACHHVLYRTMGQMILNGAIFSLLGQGISSLLTLPIRAAFYYWMRCSEYSADRAAILCDGNPDNLMEVCARLAGFSKGIDAPINMDAFMKQSETYRKMVNDNAINKTIDYMNYGYSSHPLHAIRAYEADQWSHSDNFIKSKKYFEAYHNGTEPDEFPLSWNEKSFIGKDYLEVQNILQKEGFIVELQRNHEKCILARNNVVNNVFINGDNKYNEGDWISKGSKALIRYYKPLDENEIAQNHKGQIRLETSLSSFVGKNYKDVELDLFTMGLANTNLVKIQDPKNNNKNINKVAKIVVKQDGKFNKGDWIDIMADIDIYYYSDMEE